MRVRRSCMESSVLPIPGAGVLQYPHSQPSCVGVRSVGMDASMILLVVYRSLCGEWCGITTEGNCCSARHGLRSMDTIWVMSEQMWGKW